MYLWGQGLGLLSRVCSVCYSCVFLSMSSVWKFGSYVVFYVVLILSAKKKKIFSDVRSNTVVDIISFWTLFSL